MEKSLIIPIYDKEMKSNVENYRGIALLRHHLEIYERIKSKLK